MTLTSQFADMTSSSNLFDVTLFLFLKLVTGSSVLSISSLVLELWQFPFIRDWPEIQKSEILPSEFCAISGDLGELGIPHLSQISLIKFYSILQNSRVTVFTVSELLSKSQQYPPPRLGLKSCIAYIHDIVFLNYLITKASSDQFWCTTFCKNIHIIWYFYTITNFKFKILISIFKSKINTGTCLKQ